MMSHTHVPVFLVESSPIGSSTISLGGLLHCVPVFCTEMLMTYYVLSFLRHLVPPFDLTHIFGFDSGSLSIIGG